MEIEKENRKQKKKKQKQKEMTQIYELAMAEERHRMKN